MSHTTARLCTARARLPRFDYNGYSSAGNGTMLERMVIERGIVMWSLRGSAWYILLSIFSELVISVISVFQKKKDNYQFLRYVFVIWSTRPGFLFAWRIWPAMAASWARISSPGLFQWECDHRKSQSIVNVWRHILWISNDILEVSWWFNDLLDIIWYYIDLTR